MSSSILPFRMLTFSEILGTGVVVVVSTAVVVVVAVRGVVVVVVVDAVGSNSSEFAVPFPSNPTIE